MKIKSHSIILSSIIASSACLFAGNILPYQIDAQTLSLFVFNETNDLSFADDEVSTERLTLVPAAVPDAGFGFASYEGFGTGFLGGKSVLRNPRYGANLMQGANGAFTYEAIFRVDNLDPLPSGLTGRTILGWGQGSNAGQIRLIVGTNGSVDFQFYNGVLNLGGGVGLNVRVPTSGPHAFKVGKFYHIAATYDGNEGVPGNIQFYWTALDSGAVEASRLPLYRSSGAQIEAPVASDQNFDFQASTWLVVGGNLPGTDLLFPGLIDNVRISSVARQPNDFIFVDDGSGPPPAGKAWQLTEAIEAEQPGWFEHTWWGSFYRGSDNWLFTDHSGWIYADDHYFGGNWQFWYVADVSEWVVGRINTYPWVYSFSGAAWRLIEL